MSKTLSTIIARHDELGVWDKNLTKEMESMIHVCLENKELPDRMPVIYGGYTTESDWKKRTC
jgi:hypothetical protein